MTELVELARVVRAERKRRDWGQQKLADEAGVSLGVISNLERRKNRPQPENERAILSALGLDEAPGEPEPETRQWPLDVAVFLDVMGLFLVSVPEQKRAQVIRDLTRQVMNHRT